MSAENPLSVVRAGAGPQVLLIHGSAADHTTWSIQLASPLRERFALVAYDRRFTAPTVEAHAADAARLIAAPVWTEGGDGGVRGSCTGCRAKRGVSGGPAALVVGSSFGAVVALELVRTRPELAAGAILIEPPMAAADAPPDLGRAVHAALGGTRHAPEPGAFLEELDRRAAEAGGEAAGELFLRRVLGDASYERMPRAFQDRAKSKWAEIRADASALLAYRPRYAELPAVSTPVLLLGGARSAPFFRATLDALAAALPRARLETVPAAGHMLHAEAPRRFAELLIGFADEVGIG